MIESTALFFAMTHAVFLLDYIKLKKSKYLIFSIFMGILGILTKATTLPPFTVAVILYQTMFLFAQKKSILKSIDKSFILIVFSIILPYAIGLSWVDYSDEIKKMNPFGFYITSESLKEWNYGTIGQKFSLRLWLLLIPGRMIPDLFGHIIVLFLLCSILIIVYKNLNKKFIFNIKEFKPLKLSAVLFFLFLLPIVLFTNLHIVHDYYQIANGIFLILCAALLIDYLLIHNKHIGYFAFFVLLISQISTFYIKDFQKIINPTYSSEYLSALKIKKLTEFDNIIVGYGSDWTSVVPLYAERKSLMIPFWFSNESLEESITIIKEDYEFKVGGLLLCNQESFPEALEELFNNNRNLVFIEGKCKFFMSS
jgi:hypothetical protein